MSQAAGILAIVFAVLWLGTLVHESGHALVAGAFGVRIEEVNLYTQVDKGDGVEYNGFNLTVGEVLCL